MRKKAEPKAKRPAAAAPRVEDSDGEAEVVPAPKKRAAPAPKAAKVEPNSDFEMVDEPVKKDKGKGKAAAKRKRWGHRWYALTYWSDIACSDSFEVDSDDDVKPVAKKSKATKAQAAVTDFFDVVPDPKPSKDAVAPSKARPRAVSGSKKAPAKKKAVESDLEGDDSFGAIPAPPPRDSPPKRAARGAAKKYIEIESDSAGDALDDSFMVDSD
jgi:DNA topoisomerase-2